MGIKQKIHYFFHLNLPIIVSMALMGVTIPAGAGNPVDLNTADADELQQLPGIGPVLSLRIIADREANGPFQNPQDITRVFGLGNKKYASIKDLIIASHQEGRVTRAKKISKLNLNTAAQLELESLPGIGPAKALRIIEYREKDGGFQRVEELMEVWGIGPKTYESLKNLVSVRSDRTVAPGKKPPSPSGPRRLKCWRCGHKFTVEGDTGSGKCPSCGAKWKAK